MDVRLHPQAGSLQRLDLAAQGGEAGSAGVGELRVLAPVPAGEEVRQIALGDALALVIQGVAVVGHVIEPDAVGLRALGEKQDGGGDARVGLEDTRGHRDDAVQAVHLDEGLAGLDVGRARPEQDAVGDDGGAPAADLQQAQEEVQEQQFRLTVGRQGGRFRRGHRRRVHQSRRPCRAGRAAASPVHHQW